jgi:integrase
VNKKTKTRWWLNIISLFDIFHKKNKVNIQVNQYGMIVLDGKINGKRHRLSTRKKSNLLRLMWYKYYADTLFFKHYNEQMLTKSYELTKFSVYGYKILTHTDTNRNDFTQKDWEKKFEVLCKTFGNMQLTQIKASDILIWQNQTNFQPKTIINYRSVLNIIFKFAVYDGLMQHNPLSVVQVPKSVRADVEYFTQKEIELLVHHASGQIKNIILFVAFTGVRAGELIGLKWSDIDFRKKTILIQRRIREGIEDVPKSKRSRLLDMLPQAKQALMMQKELTYKTHEFVFVSRFDEPYTRSNHITASIRKICRETGIKEGGLQKLRRSCNTLYKQYGLPNDWILDQLGHMNDEVNIKHYTGKIKPNLSSIGKVLAE